VWRSGFQPLRHFGWQPFPGCFSVQASNQQAVLPIHHITKIVPDLNCGFLGDDNPRGIHRLAPGAVTFDPLEQGWALLRLTPAIGDLIQSHGFGSPNWSVNAFAAGCSLPHPKFSSVALLLDWWRGNIAPKHFVVKCYFFAVAFLWNFDFVARLLQISFFTPRLIAEKEFR